MFYDDRFSVGNSELQPTIRSSVEVPRMVVYQDM